MIFPVLVSFTFAFAMILRLSYPVTHLMSSGKFNKKGEEKKLPFFPQLFAFLYCSFISAIFFVPDIVSVLDVVFTPKHSANHAIRFAPAPE